jgi:hypothetical protein
LIVADGGGIAFIWNALPTTDGQAANVVLGQPDGDQHRSPHFGAKSVTNPNALHVGRGSRLTSPIR